MAVVFRKRSRGFTLIESLVVVTVMAVLLGLAAPSMHGIYQNWRVQKTVSAMESSILLARSEAVRRGGKVALERLTAADSSCPASSAASQWNCGWFLFVDANDNGRWDGTEERIQEVPLPDGMVVSNAFATTSLQFDRYGLVRKVTQLSTKVFTVEPASASAAYGNFTRVLCMGTTGIMHIERATSCS